MANMELLLPNCSQKAIEEVVRKQKIHEFKLTVSNGTSVGNNYLGEIYRVVITGVKDNGEKTSVSLIVKSAPMAPELRQFIQLERLYAREILMYDKILPKIESYQKVLEDDEKFGIVKFYLARRDESCDLLILEDLAEKGFQTRDKHNALDYEHIELVIKNMARLHAGSILLKIKELELFEKTWDYSPKYSEYNDSPDVFLNKYRTGLMKMVAGQDYEEKVINMFNGFKNHYVNLVDNAKCEPYNVICHGDCWIGNLLFKYEKEKLSKIHFLDWQGMRVSSPVIDLSYFMFISIDREIRKKYYNKLLKVYYETLEKQSSKLGIDLSEHYPEFVYKIHQRMYMKYGVLMAIISLPTTLNDDHIELGQIMKDENQGGIDSFNFSEACKEKLHDVFRDAFDFNVI